MQPYIQYHAIGDQPEICIEWDGAFVGFIVHLDHAGRWGAYDRRLELISDDHDAAADAAAACYNRSLSEKRITIGDILVDILAGESLGRE